MFVAIFLAVYNIVQVFDQLIFKTGIDMLINSLSLSLSLSLILPYVRLIDTEE